MRINAIESRTAYFVSLILMVCCTVTLAAPLQPNDIVSLHQEGKNTDQIIAAIAENGIGFDVTLPILENLITKGVSQEVLEVLLNNTSEPTAVKRDYISFNPGKKKAGISVITDPPGLTLTIDGKKQGVTPSFSNKLSKGTHIFKVAHPLFFSKQEEIVFNGTDDLNLNWEMEPREPIIRVDVKIDKGSSSEPWSWILRPRNQCPGCEVNLQLKPWKNITKTGEAIFLLTDSAKRSFRGKGTCCIELNVWKGEVRRDLPIRKLPPPDARFFITDIQVDGIQVNDLTLNVKVKDFSVDGPEVIFSGDSGYIIEAELLPEGVQKPERHDDIIESLDGILP